MSFTAIYWNMVGVAGLGGLSFALYGGGNRLASLLLVMIIAIWAVFIAHQSAAAPPPGRGAKEW